MVAYLCAPPMVIYPIYSPPPVAGAAEPYMAFVARGFWKKKDCNIALSKAQNPRYPS